MKRITRFRPQLTTTDWAIRRIDGPSVEVEGVIYTVDDNSFPYDGRLDGMWMAFGRYVTYPGDARAIGPQNHLPILSLWGLAHVWYGWSQTNPVPEAVDGLLHWMWWRTKEDQARHEAVAEKILGKYWRKRFDMTLTDDQRQFLNEVYDTYMASGEYRPQTPHDFIRLQAVAVHRPALVTGMPNLPGAWRPTKACVIALNREADHE
jgi:hypothetical protein